MTLNKKTVIGVALAAAALVLVLIYLFNLVVYIAVAFIISMIGRPLVQWLHRRFKCPFGVGSVIALIAIMGFVVGLGWLIWPKFVQQGQTLMSLDYAQLSTDTHTGFLQIENYLTSKGIAVSEDALKTYVIDGVEQLAAAINFKDLVANTAGFLVSFGVGLFCVVFIAFFFLKDEKLFKKMLFLFIPDRYVERAENVLHSCEYLLGRYFVGISIEVLCMMFFLSLGLWICGIEQAVLYGCLGGLLNVIPYLGPVIGAVIAAVFAVVNHLDVGFSMQLGWVILQVALVFTGANLIDNFVLQPLIYSSSVKSSPLEIFFVIIVAGTLTGPFGMILAIPLYTVLRVFAKEFLKGNKIVDSLTRQME